MCSCYVDSLTHTIKLRKIKVIAKAKGKEMTITTPSNKNKNLKQI